MTPLHAAPRRLAPPRARGLTLIELLVAVTILVIMIYAFGQILSQSQTVVTKSQRKMRANAQAAAVAQVFRRDIASLTTDGFLYVGPDDAPAVVFTAVGSFVSRMSRSAVPPIANAAVICYNSGEDASDENAGKVLCREAHLLDKPPGLSGSWNTRRSDVTRMYLSSIQVGVSGAAPADIVRKFTRHMPIPTLPQTIAEVNKTWPAVVKNCKNIQVEYRRAGDNMWRAGRKNVSLWSYADRNRAPNDPKAWPVALRLTFQISDIDFEVICPVGQ